MIDLIVIIVLSLVIMLLVIDRYFMTEQHQRKEDRLMDELSKAVKAVIAKNANDYVMTTSIDKVPSERATEPTNPDVVPEEAITDDEFFTAIQKRNKAEN